MSEPRIFRVPNKLREKLLKSGGARVAELLAQADSNLDFMRPRCLNQVSDLIGEIVAAYGPASRSGDEPFETLYQLSAKIIDASTPIADLEIDRAAYSLCELVDRCEGQQAWDWPSVDVHIDALQLLRLDAGALPPEAREKIFLGLQKVTQRLPSLARSQSAKDGGEAPEADEAAPAA